MKKIFTIVILVILTICMTACVKRSIGTEEEKKYFNDFFKSQDEIENPTYVSYYLTYEKDKKTYKYVYTFRYTKQNEIEVRVFDCFDNNYNIYIYDNGKLSHFIYDIPPKEYTIPLESEEDIISDGLGCYDSGLESAATAATSRDEHPGSVGYPDWCTPCST